MISVWSLWRTLRLGMKARLGRIRTRGTRDSSTRVPGFSSASIAGIRPRIRLAVAPLLSVAPAMRRRRSATSGSSMVFSYSSIGISTANIHTPGTSIRLWSRLTGCSGWTTVSSSVVRIGLAMLGMVLLTSGNIHAVYNPQGLDREGYARWLFDQADYYRTIGVYKELIYCETADSSHCDSFVRRNRMARYSLGCAEAYRKSGRHRSALAYYARVIESSATTSAVHTAACMGMGITYSDMSFPATAIGWFGEAIPSDSSGVAALCQAQMKAELGRWNEASQAFHRTAAEFPPLHAVASNIAERSLHGHQLPHKSSALATCLSAAVPGSGQWYAGHHYDAVLALGYVGTMAAATYAFWKLDDETDWGAGPFYISFALTSVLHAANILGARKTVQYRNMRTIRDHLSAMRKLAFPETVLPLNPERRSAQ